MKSTIPGGPLNEVAELRSIPEMLMVSAEKYPEKRAISEPADAGKFRSISYLQLRNNVDWLAKGIIEMNPQPVAGIVGKNSISWCTAYLAALRAGGIVVPIDRELSISEIHTILHYSGANIIFFDGSFLKGFLEHDSNHGRSLRRICMNEGCSKDSLQISHLIHKGRGSDIELPESYDLEAPASICYTSGTMGQAKGVMLSQNNILSDIRQMYQYVEIVKDDVFLSVLPVHHTYECTCGFLGPISVGSSISICGGLKNIVDDIITSGATVIVAVPLLWEAMYRRIIAGIKARKGGRFKYRLGLAMASVAESLGSSKTRGKIFSQVHQKFGGTLKLLVSGGAGIDPDVVAGFGKLGFVFLQGYGLTETSPIVSVNRVGANRHGSVGLPFREVEVVIDDPDESGTGEVVVRGPNIMVGYHNNPEATSEVLSPEGWFRTGDYGYLDRDGFLYITGRKKNVIVAKNGKNVYPEEIETKLNRSVYISESMIFGRKSSSKGEEIWVIIVPNTDRLIEEAEAKGENLTREDAVEVIGAEVKKYNSSCAAFKRIARFMIRDEEFPKTTTRKIRRREIFREAGLEQEESYRV